MGQFTKKPVTVEAVQFNKAGDHPAVEIGVGGGYVIEGRQGFVGVNPGDWIIAEANGVGFYPCAPDVFAATYAPASIQADSKGEPALSLAETQAVVETKTAPRVTEASIKAKIADVEYFRIRHLTICLITLRNGFFVTGESAPAAPENYDQAVGERYAYENAFRKIWPFEGYLLREQLAAQETPDRAHDDLGRVA
ncbi:Gp49 family protein [Methylobacterium sp. R2-1]|uniref:Gp49 family protein n=1 Tax=Methylobacterium sp. R2-1 TaxID=2587064 RepID=UPI0017E024F3|nr:Gp49 family protein [Methylobacterium sp. R2-1]MBB2962894.1 hypothetical protein [Methylobacterium sp. R2-1]